MQEWFRKTGGYWAFGTFILALLALFGGVGHWALNAESAKQDAKVEHAVTAITSEVARVEAVALAQVEGVETVASAEVAMVEVMVDENRSLINRIDSKLDRMDAKLDALLVRLPARP